jgi:cobalt/nickel transport system ATP-binding protein
MSCLVEVHHLRYAYPEGREALREVSFHLSHGERVGLIGPNGVGKTTLLLILAGVIESFSGAVQVAGCDLATREGRRSVHRKLGVVFQNTDDQLINASVEEDVAFGPLNLGLPAEEVRRRVAAALASVGLAEGYRPRIPFHLSAGEKRRVAIAGVMAMRPEIVLMDEPTSDLDPRGRRELARILAELPVTRIISSHNLDFVLETCDRVLLLDEGQLRADGPVRRVLADEALMLRHGLEVPAGISAAERAAVALAGPLAPLVHSHDHAHPH